MTAPTAVADLFAAACRQRDVRPPVGLRLGSGDPGRVPHGGRIDPHDLGRLHEQALTEADRRTQGAWYTPAWLATRLVELAVHGPGTVADPSCGGGAFLLAAVERLVDLGVSPGDAVRSVWGADVDEAAVHTAEAALWLWTVDHGEPTMPPAGHLVVADVLAGAPWRPDGGVSAVVGNPPFLGQLRKRTATGAIDRERLRRRFGDLVGAYTDPAWLFLVAAAEMTAAGGVVCLVQPQSLLSARDADAIRRHLDHHAPLVDCWVGRGDEFGASVNVCAPVLEVGAPTPATTWTTPVSDAAGVPDPVVGEGSGQLTDMVSVLAGFRADYYGLLDAVEEAGDDDTRPRLITTGAIDPLHCRWSEVPTRFAKRSWTKPVIDVERADRRGRAWVDAQAAAKIVVATQTRVVEGVVDPHGTLVASVPALAVIPHAESDLWLAAAVLHAPPVAAWCRRRAAGSGMSPTAMRVTGAMLAAIPLPADRGAWEAAADLAEAIHHGRGSWAAFSVAASAAYGNADVDLDRWWHRTRPVR